MKNSGLPRIEYEMPVMFFDTDCGGVIHNLAYLRFVETARTIMAGQMGMRLAEMAAEGLYPVVLRTEIDYLSPGKFGDRILVRGGVSEVGRTLSEAIARNKWSATQHDVARLFARAAPGRAPLFEPGQAATQEVMLQSLTSPRPPTTTPVPALTPPSGAVFARIYTRKMTREELVVRTGNTQPGTETLPADFHAAMSLVQKGLLTRQQLETAQSMATTEGRSLASTLVENGADEDVVVAAISEVTKTTSVARKRVIEAVPGPEAMALFPLELSRAAKAIPLGLKGNQLMVAMADPMDAQALELIKRACQGESLLTFRAGERCIVEGRSRLCLGAHRARARDLQPHPERSGGRLRHDGVRRLVAHPARGAGPGRTSDQRADGAVGGAVDAANRAARGAGGRAGRAGGAAGDTRRALCGRGRARARCGSGDDGGGPQHEPPPVGRAEAARVSRRAWLRHCS
jgi:YbgC/YbaW family acyl-CoA thioester hydrolase